jgi:hypothetical protein
MSSRQRKGKVASATKSAKQEPHLQGMHRADPSNEYCGTASSMDTVRIQPRTSRQGAHATEEVELTLLEEDEQRQAAVGVLDDDYARAGRPKRPMSTQDKRSMGLLIILCEFPCRYRGKITNRC